MEGVSQMTECSKCGKELEAKIGSAEHTTVKITCSTCSKFIKERSEF